MGARVKGGRMTRFFLVFPLIMVLMAGCMNMPTKPVQITGAYVSDEEYKSWPCDKLSREYNQLGERENILTTAQEQRYKSSQMQAGVLVWLWRG